MRLITQLCNVDKTVEDVEVDVNFTEIAPLPYGMFMMNNVLNSLFARRHLYWQRCRACFSAWKKAKDVADDNYT